MMEFRRGAEYRLTVSGLSYFVPTEEKMRCFSKSSGGGGEL